MSINIELIQPIINWIQSAANSRSTPGLPGGNISSYNVVEFLRAFSSIKTNLAHVYWTAGSGVVNQYGCSVSHVGNSGTWVLTFGSPVDVKNINLTISVGLQTAAFATFQFVNPSSLEIYVFDKDGVKLDPDELIINLQ